MKILSAFTVVFLASAASAQDLVVVPLPLPVGSIVIPNVPPQFDENWFTNTKEAGSFYQNRLDRLSLHTYATEPGMEITEEERDLTGFSAVERIFRGDENAFLKELRSTGPLCEEVILARWQRLLPEKSLETFLYYLRKRDLIDDLVLRAFLNIYSAFAEDGSFPSEEEVSLPGNPNVDPALIEYAVSGNYSKLKKRTMPRTLVDLHFDRCFSKIHRTGVQKADDRKIQQAYIRSFNEQLFSALEQAKADPEFLARVKELTSRATDTRVGRATRKRTLGKEEMTLDSIRRLATGHYWSLGKEIRVRGIRNRNRIVKASEILGTAVLVIPEKSRYLVAESKVNTYGEPFSQRQWLYEIVSRVEPDAVTRNTDNSITNPGWTTVLSALGGTIEGGGANIILSDGRKYLHPIPDTEAFRLVYEDFLVRIQRDLLIQKTRMNYDSVVAAGIETANLRDIDVWKLGVELEYILAKGQPPEDEAIQRANKVFGYASTMSMFVPGPMRFFGGFFSVLPKLFPEQTKKVFNTSRKRKRRGF